MNKWLNKLERKLGKYAIQNLMFYIIILYAVGFVIDLFAPEVYYNWLALDAGAILQGQIWRVITFIIKPPETSLLFVIFTLYLYYMIGSQLEHIWGTFRFNLYYFTGVLLHVIAAFVVYAITDLSLPMDTYYLNMSLFFAFAAIFPNQKLYLFGLIPIKMKYLAWLDGVYFVYAIYLAIRYGSQPVIGAYYIAAALAAFVSILNFVLFFFATRNYYKVSPKQVKRRREYQKALNEVIQTQTDAGGARHRCTVCGRTEITNPELEFRYCSKCNGNYEYCQDHLFTHEHVK